MKRKQWVEPVYDKNGNLIYASVSYEEPVSQNESGCCFNL